MSNTILIEEVGVVENKTIKGFKITPNPAGDYIELSGVETHSCLSLQNNIYIYNILGECVPPRLASQATPQEENSKIDISSLAAGVYYLKIGKDVKIFIKL